MIDLRKLSLEAREQVLIDYAAKGIHVARVGDRVTGCGGVGTITTGTDVFYKGGGGRAIAVVSSRYRIPACAHGCPACPHPCTGLIITGHPDLIIGGAQVAIVGSKGVHAACCWANRGVVSEGFGKPVVPARVKEVAASDTQPPPEGSDHLWVG